MLAVIALIAFALLFDYTNGFHDSANSIATVVATRVLRPRWAVLWAAGWNFVAFFFVGTAVPTPSDRPSAASTSVSRSSSPPCWAP